MTIERTLAIIKPDAWPQHGGSIIAMATDAGLVPVEMEVRPVAAFIPGKRRVDGYRGVRSWENFYAEHEGRAFFSSLVYFMASGPILAMVLAGDDAIARWRALMGPTDSRKATPGTVRSFYGAPFGAAENGFLGGEYPMWRNAVHGSDSPEAAAREIDFFGF
jgi:nucleoside-diphosphate kinase